MKLSIMICVYNTPIPLLSGCLDSICNSNVADIDGGYEICMLDDGSHIDYSDVLEKYPVKYKKTENRGILNARKAVLDMADGEYAIYCDSDDTVSFNYYLPMIKKADETSSDITINDWALHTGDTRYYRRNDDTIKYDLDLTGEDILPEFFKNEGRQHSFYVLWNKLYKASLLRAAFAEIEKYKNPPFTSYGEDTVINFFAWSLAKRIVNVHTGFYFYRIHTNQTVNVTDAVKLRSQADSMSFVFDMMRTRIAEHARYSEMVSHINAWKELSARAHFSNAKRLNNPEIIEYIKQKYGVSKVRGTTYRDECENAYTSLIGNNFDDIDDCLKEIWNSQSEVSATYDEKDRYVSNNIAFFSKNGVVFRQNCNYKCITIPKQVNTFKQKVVHNSFIYKVSTLFFKKDSRLRNFLKKFL